MFWAVNRDSQWSIWSAVFIETCSSFWLPVSDVPSRRRLHDVASRPRLFSASLIWNLSTRRYTVPRRPAEETAVCMNLWCPPTSACHRSRWQCGGSPPSLDLSGFKSPSLQNVKYHIQWSGRLVSVGGLEKQQQQQQQLFTSMDL